MRLIQNNHCASYGEDIEDGKLAEEIAQTFPELDVFASTAEQPPVWRL